MKTLSRIVPLLFLLVTLVCCQEEKEVQPTNAASDSFAVVIKSGGLPEPVVEKKEAKDSLVQQETRPDGSIWRCVSKKYNVEEANNEFPLFNPNASVIYPGNLLQGATLKSASPSVIPVKRGGGTVSIDIIDGSEGSSFTVEEVKKSTIADAANKIIGASTGAVPANFNFTAQQVQSQQELALSLGLDVQTQFVQVGSTFSFRSGSQYSRFIVKLKQSFYTLSFDIPTSAGDLFAPGVTPADLDAFVGPGNPVTFISDVTYGRVYYLLIESSSSETAIESAINASFTGAAVGVDLEVNGSYLKSLSDLQIKVVALGGSSQSTFQTIGQSDIGSLVELLGESTDITTGVPVSYVVRSAVNREVVSVKLATEYEVTECTPLAAPLGEPMLWFDAGTLSAKWFTPAGESETPCNDCLEENGLVGFYRTNNAITLMRPEENPRGLVIRQWNDRSKNRLHASAVASDPYAKPLYVPGAFNNGRPAVEFYKGRTGYADVFSRLTYAGGVFANTDYTVFAVVAYPERVVVQWLEKGAWKTIADRPNGYGYFLQGTNDQDLRQLRAGFQNNALFRLSHRGDQLMIESPGFKPSAGYQVLALRFSRTEGMSVYRNGVLVAADPAQKRALVSNEGAMLCAPHLPGRADEVLSRVRLGEFKAYNQAATEAQIRQETLVLSQKYGL